MALDDVLPDDDVLAAHLQELRRGTVVADDLSPKTSSIQDVEDVITGDHIVV